MIEWVRPLPLKVWSVDQPHGYHVRPYEKRRVQGPTPVLLNQISAPGDELLILGCHCYSALVCWATYTMYCSFPRGERALEKLSVFALGQVTYLAAGPGLDRRGPSIPVSDTVLRSHCLCNPICFPLRCLPSVHPSCFPSNPRWPAL